MASSIANNARNTCRDNDDSDEDYDNFYNNEYRNKLHDFDNRTNNNDTGTATATGLRRRKNATTRNNKYDSSNDDDDDDNDNNMPFFVSSIDRPNFAPSFKGILHVRTVKKDGYNTPPRSPSPKLSANNRLKTSIPHPLPSLVNDPLRKDDIVGYNNGNNTERNRNDGNNNQEEEIDFLDVFVKPSKLKKAKDGTETTSNMNSSRTSISAELNNSFELISKECYNNNNNESENSIELISVELPPPPSMEFLFKDTEKGYGRTKTDFNKSSASGSNFDDNSNGDDNDSKLPPGTKKYLKLFRDSRIFVGSLVNNVWVQLFIIILIVINAMMMGLATLTVVTSNPSTEKLFHRIDQAFLVVFTIEVLMQLYYFGFALFHDGWLVFDFVIVSISWAFESLQVIRSFRIFRAFRLVTRLKPLRDLVLALGKVMPRLYAIFVLLIIIFYIFAVLFTELFSDMVLSADYFTSLDKSMFTCMQFMTLEWGDVTREVMEQKSWSWFPIVTFVTICGFIVFNLFVAVVVEAVGSTEETIRELDGLEDDSPEAKLEEAEERIDLLQSHIDNMMTEQETIQTMLETMAGELLHLETERVKAEHREVELNNEINRRIEQQNNTEVSQQKNQLHNSCNNSTSSFYSSLGSLDQIEEVDDRERRKLAQRGKVEEMYLSLSSSHGDESTRTLRTRRKRSSVGVPFAKGSITQSSNKPLKRQGSDENISKRVSSDKSFGVVSCPDGFLNTDDLPGSRSAPTYRRTLDLDERQKSTRPNSQHIRSKQGSQTPDQSKKQSLSKDKGNWKSMLAIKPL